MSNLRGLITDNPLERELFSGRMYARTNYHKARRKFAYEAIRAMLKLGERFHVSLSFGKQSLVVAHMLYRTAPEMPMLFLASSESWLMHDFADVIDRFLSRWPINLTIVQTNNAALDISAAVADLSRRQPSIHWRFKPPGDPGWTWKQSRDYGQHDLQDMTDRGQFDGWFWGLAKEESRNRRITLSLQWDGQPHPAIYRYGDGKYRCCPLANWQALDLAAYIATHDLPMLDAYRRQGLSARTTARVTRKAAEQGFMSLSRHYNMQVVNHLCARFPELRGAI